MFGHRLDRMQLDATRMPLWTDATVPLAAIAANGDSATYQGVPAADGVWAIADGSFAGFRCQVSMLGRVTSLVGQSDALAGGIHVVNGAVEAGSIRINLASLRILGKANPVLNHMIDTPRYPIATFTLNKPISMPASPLRNVTYRAPASGSLTMHGRTQPVSFTFAARYTASMLEGAGSVAIRFSDWNLRAPFGVQNNGAIDFTLRMSRSGVREHCS